MTTGPRFAGRKVARWPCRRTAEAPARRFSQDPCCHGPRPDIPHQVALARLSSDIYTLQPAIPSAKVAHAQGSRTTRSRARQTLCRERRHRAAVFPARCSANPCAEGGATPGADAGIFAPILKMDAAASAAQECARQIAPCPAAPAKGQATRKSSRARFPIPRKARPSVSATTEISAASSGHAPPTTAAGTPSSSTSVYSPPAGLP